MKPRRSALAALLASTCAAPGLAAEATVLEAVTVTASNEAEAERQATVTQKTVIDRQEIESLGGLTVNEVIRKLPGIEAGAHGGDGGPSANARGMGRDAVQFLVDGERPSANARYALTTVGRLPAGELERVEILRGASAEHGGSAPVTVNLVMRKARTQGGTALKAALGSRGGAANGQFTLSQGGGGAGFSWILPLTLNHHALPQEKNTLRRQSTVAGPTLRQEERERSPYQLDELIVSPRLSWRGGDGSLSLWPSLYHNRGERHGDFSRNAATATGGGSEGELRAAGSRREREESQLTIARLRLEGEQKSALGKLSGRVAAMAARREQETERRWLDATGNASHGREAIDRDEHEFASALRLDRPAGDGLLSAGIEQSWHRREESQRATGVAVYSGDTDARASQWTGWLQHEWPLAKALTLTYGLRGEHVVLAAEGRQHSASQLAPALAGRFEFASDLILRSSLGAGLKAPKLEEISGLTVRGAGFNSPLEADRGGNANLKAERNLNWELALDKHLPNEAGTVGANIYVRRTADFIERRSTLEGTRWVERPYNEGTARHWGLELDARLKGEAFGWKGAALRSHLTLPQARVADQRLGSVREARDLPRYQWSLGVDQALPWWQASAGFQFNLYGATRSAIPGESTSEQKARRLLDLYLTRRLTPQLNLRFEAQNVLAADTRRLARAWHGGDDWSLSGRERGQRGFFLSLEGKW